MSHDPGRWPLRLRLHRRIDRTAYWLINHNRHGAARTLWRAFRMI